MSRDEGSSIFGGGTAADGWRRHGLMSLVITKTTCQRLMITKKEALVMAVREVVGATVGGASV
jgi:hypothetical protein